MNRIVFLLLFAFAVGCGRNASDPPSDAESPVSDSESIGHPQVDFDHWAQVFPIETFEKTSGPHQFAGTEPGSPLDLWKAGGAIITSPAHLCEIELARKQCKKEKDLGRAVPVDIFLWSIAPPEKPYLTKLGGVPHREAANEWPIIGGKPLTFVSQFCFADSRDIVSDKLPGDIMLIFFADAGSAYEETVHIEWSSLQLKSPLTADKCPAPSFHVPRLSGHIYRTNEYPDSEDVFEQAGHNQYYLFSTTQSTKIGRETLFVQGDPRGANDELLCTLNSIHPTRYPKGATWPFIGLQSLPDDWDQPDDDYGWGKYQMMFGDVGCMYFLIDDDGNVSWSMACY